IRAGVHGRVEIGDRVAINSFVQIYGHGGVSIGDETQLGPGTIVTTTGHDYADEKLEASFTPIVIGRRVWVGAHVTIIGGVTIGDSAVIGAGAVVIRDIPPHTLAVGVPARVVRRLDRGGGNNGDDPALQDARSAPPASSSEDELPTSDTRIVAPLGERRVEHQQSKEDDPRRGIPGAVRAKRREDLSREICEMSHMEIAPPGGPTSTPFDAGRGHAQRSFERRLHRSMYLGAQRLRGRPIGKLMRRLAEWDRLDAEAYSALSRARLEEMLTFAAARVPLYRSGPWTDVGGGAADIARWPLLDRRLIAEDRDALIPDGTSRRLLFARRSSASTGTPVVVSWSLRGIAWSWAAEYHPMLWHGLEIGARTL